MPTLNQLIRHGREEKRDFTPFLICGYNIVLGFFNVVWYPGEVASPLIIVGGSSAIFFLFLAKSYEERSLSLLSFFVNNVILFYLLQMPAPCSFLVGLFLIMLASFHLYLWLGDDVFFNVIFFAVLLSRIFYHQKMGEWGFGLVTELLFLRLFFLCFALFLQKEDRSEEGSRIEPFVYLIPLFSLAFLNLQFSLDYGLKEILIHMNFLFAAATLLFFSFFSNTIKKLKISILLYIIGNLSIGYFLAKSVMMFFQVSFAFLVSNSLFASFFFLKAARSKGALSEILIANKREGIQTLLVVYFLILGVLLTQLTGSPALSVYSNWLVGLGIQIGFLTALNYFFKK